MRPFALNTRWTAAAVPLFAFACLCLWGVIA